VKKFNARVAQTGSAIVMLGLSAGCAQLSGISIPSPADFFRPSINIPNESDIITRVYDGVTDDLLTAGLGKTGIGAAQPPAARDASNPTPKEVRQRAIHANYRALIDTNPNGGYGRMYGPNIDLNGGDTLGEGKIAGIEYIALVQDRERKVSATVMVQIPTSFSQERPCIVTATSSGSRGVYGAIGTSGDWGLKRGCVVAYTDKATGSGIHDLGNDRVYLVDGTKSTAATAGSRSTFTAELGGTEGRAYLERSPNRFAFKHANSQQNVERLWGEFTLAAVEFAFDRMNKLQDKRKAEYTRANTIVIASSLSNGAYGGLMAAEQDTAGLIDGVVATEPNASLKYNSLISIKQGDALPTKAHSANLLDYTTIINLFAPCASLDASLSTAPLNVVPAVLRTARCESLAAKGLLSSTTLAAQAKESLEVLKTHGLQNEGLFVQPAQYTLNVPQSISVAYAMAYGRFGVGESLCGYSFGATEGPAAGTRYGTPIALAGAEWLFASSNGIAPTAGIGLISDLSVGGPKDDRAAISDSTKKLDLNIDGAICLREVYTGAQVGLGGAKGEPFPVGSVRYGQAGRIAKGIEETLMTGNLKGKPTIIVSPRSDGLLPINHTGRAYYANAVTSFPKTAANVRLYEVTNTQHLDVLNGIAGFDSKFVPTYVYFTQAMNLMWDHLVDKKPLPASQVVRTIPRALVDGKAGALTSANVPVIASKPETSTMIKMNANVLSIPE
jgi:hydroxybutyrate-dimer hydrolase